jgi:hypothetical protein
MVGKVKVRNMFKKLVLPVAVLASLAAMAPMALRAASTNLIDNPSVETVSTTGAPTNWSNTTTGINTTAFNYLNTGHTGAHSLQVQMTKRSSGNAKWYFTPVAVNPNTQYTFSDWYQSNIANHIQVVATSDPVASSAWKQNTLSFTTPANAKTVTVYHYVNRVGQLTTDDFDLEGPAVVPPTVNVTAPVANATVSGSVTISANATDSKGVKNVQFKLDGNNLGAADTTSPYSVAWDTKTIANGTHALSAVVTNTNNVTATATNVNVNVNNPSAPTVSFTAPANGSTVSGSAVAVSANASDNVGVLGVQFKLDGANLGAEDTTAPYSVNMDSTTITNGNHTLSAVARNGAALTSTATETVNVQNTVVTPPTPPASPNLILNPSLETANGTAPASWLSSNWGTNTTTFSYLSTGHTGSHSVKVESTAYTNGAANWYYADLPVSSGKTYKYENWYQSNVDTEVDAEVLMNDGTTQYYWVGTVSASPTWANTLRSHLTVA